MRYKNDMRYKKSEEQNSAMQNIKTLYKSWENVIKLLNDYSKIKTLYES